MGSNVSWEISVFSINKVAIFTKNLILEQFWMWFKIYSFEYPFLRADANEYDEKNKTN